MSLEHVEIDDELLARVTRLQGLASTEAAVDYALRQLVGDPVSLDGTRGDPVSLDGTRGDPLNLDEALGMRGSGWEVKPAATDRGSPAAP